MAITILVVEDDSLLQSSIVRILKSRNYHAVGAGNIRDGKKLFETEKPDIVLLDIMLPDGKGYELLPLLAGSAKVMIMTALTDKDSKYLCYEYGAEDYLIKNFDMQEMLYKIDVMNRNLKRDTLTVGDVVLDGKRQQLRCDGRTVDLPHSQVELFQMLYHSYRKSTYLPKDDVVPVRADEVDESARIQNRIARLRKSLSQVQSQKVLIETVYGKGYQLVIVQ
jgi:DNA-binding response OmpR family regulator